MQAIKSFQGKHISPEDGFRAREFLLDQFSSNDQVDAFQLYSEMFPSTQSSGDTRQPGDLESEVVPNPILLYAYDSDKSGKNKLSQRVMFSDTLKDDCENLIEGNDFAFVSGLSYVGRKNVLAKATKLNAFIVDLDSVPVRGVLELLDRTGEHREGTKYKFPRPTFISYSGTGLHLYYVLENPIPLYPNQKGAARDFKTTLTEVMWRSDMFTTLDQPQYQGINQGFRCPGSVNEKYGLPVVTVRTGPKVTIDSLREDIRLDGTYRSERYPQLDWNPVDSSGASGLTIEQAKEAWPEWYERVIVRNEKRDIPEPNANHKLYTWWLNRLVDEVRNIRVGHRFWAIYTLGAMARKSKVSFEQYKQDVIDILYPAILEYYIEGDPAFTVDDVEAALKSFEVDGIWLMRRETISKMSGLEIQPQKRNGRDQETHLKIARMLNDIKHPDGEWRWKHGKQITKDKVVQEWRNENPLGTQVQCMEETGLSNVTVGKYWGDRTSPAELKVMQWRLDNPNGNKAQCIREVGLSKMTVYRYWNSVDDESVE